MKYLQVWLAFHQDFRSCRAQGYIRGSKEVILGKFLGCKLSAFGRKARNDFFSRTCSSCSLWMLGSLASEKHIWFEQWQHSCIQMHGSHVLLAVEEERIEDFFFTSSTVRGQLFLRQLFPYGTKWGLLFTSATVLLMISATREMYWHRSSFRNP